MGLDRLRFGIALGLATLLALPALGQYGYHFGRNKIQYDDFDWNILKTEHFDIYYYPEMQELAEHGAFFAEEVYEELESKFNFSLVHRTPIIFYSSNLHFKQTNVTSGFIPDGVGGFFEFLKGRVVIPANGDLHRFRRVVRHEMVHVFTYNKLLRVMRDYRKPPDRFLPLWFTEGLAEYWSGDRDFNHEMVMRDALFSNYLVPLDNMYRIYGTYQMYKQGEAICRFIAEEYGEEKLLLLIENFWRDRDFDRVMENALREDFDVIADKWLAWVKKQYYPLLKEADVPSLVADAVAVKGFNAKPVSYQFADGTRRVYFVGNHSGYSNVFQVDVDENHQPLGDPKVLIHGERNDRFEAFHLFESRISISPQGTLAFVTKSGERDVIHLYDLEADKLGQSYGFEDLVAVYSPAWNPEGTALVFSSIDRSGFSDLYTYHIADDELRKLTNDTYDDANPSWSPDGERIAFVSDRTAHGLHGAYNVFTYDLTSGQVQYVTYGDRRDLSPRWSPEGDYLLFASTQRGENGRYDTQNIWVADMTQPLGEPPVVAAAGTPPELPAPRTSRELRQLTNFNGAVFDPIWTGDNRLLFTSFEGFRFAIRSLGQVDSLIAHPKRQQTTDLAQAESQWAYGRIQDDEEGVERVPYRRKYQLDIAHGSISQSAVLGTTGGAVIAFSDMLGDDYLYLTLYSGGSDVQSDFLKTLSFSLARYQFKKRTNYGYGLYRFSGRRFDITDPDASIDLPVLYETLWGGFGAVSYPLSKFRRLDFSTSVTWSDKEIPISTSQGTNFNRQALLLSNSLSLVHDNALYYYNGPIDGWRGGLTAAYTTDVLYSNVSYITLTADLRHYLRISRDVTFASWGLFRMNHGREARLWFMGGSWDMRGYPFFRIRGKKMWFTSHELRFPILNNPSLYIPILAPFGIVNLRGAFFGDMMHAWNEEYDRNDYQNADGTFDEGQFPLFNRDERVLAGETLTSLGMGLRLNLFGGFVLRYDWGYRYRGSGFDDRQSFRQFFFGWDF